MLHRTLAGFLACLLGVAASAQAPESRLAERITYSGLLTDDAGTPLDDGDRTLIFKAYATFEDAVSSAPLWEEAHAAAIVGGRFFVILGSKTPLAPEGQWYTIAVDGEAPSLPTRLDAAVQTPIASRAFAPGGTLDDSYDNGSVVNVDQGRPLVFRGTPGSFYTGLQIKDITAVFSNEELLRFRLRSVQGGASWEYRVYGSLGNHQGAVPPGSFAISNASVQGATDAFIMFPNAARDLLRLDSDRLTIGSPVSQGGLIAYTTPDVSAPENGRISASLRDELGRGAGLRLWEERGSTPYFQVIPDAGNTGGYLQMQGGANRNALVVDGNNGLSGTTLVIGEPTETSVAFVTSSAGSASVQLPADAIQASEILDEPGIGFAQNSLPVQIPAGTPTATLVRSVTPPASGWALVLGTVEATLYHTTGGNSTMIIGVANDCDGTPTLPNSQQTNFTVAGNAPSGTYSIPVTVQGVYTVGPGTTTFCIYARPFSTTNGGEVRRQNLSVTYLPTAYGLVNSPDEPLQDPSVEGSVGSAPTPADIAAERAATEQFTQDRLREGIREVRAQLDALSRQIDSNNSHQTGNQ